MQLVVNWLQPLSQARTGFACGLHRLHRQHALPRRPNHTHDWVSICIVHSNLAYLTYPHTIIRSQHNMRLTHNHPSYTQYACTSHTIIHQHTICTSHTIIHLKHNNHATHSMHVTHNHPPYTQHAPQKQSTILHTTCTSHTSIRLQNILAWWNDQGDELNELETHKRYLLFCWKNNEQQCGNYLATLLIKINNSGWV